MYYIYGLHLEGDEEIRYVGLTTDPRRRLRGHLSCKRGADGQIKGDWCNRAKGDWVLENHDLVRIKIIETVDEDPRGAEARMIDSLTAQGHRLFNIVRPRRFLGGIPGWDSSLRWRQPA